MGPTANSPLLGSKRSPSAFPKPAEWPQSFSITRVTQLCQTAAKALAAIWQKYLYS